MLDPTGSANPLVNPNPQPHLTPTRRDSILESAPPCISTSSLSSKSDPNLSKNTLSRTSNGGVVDVLHPTTPTAPQSSRRNSASLSSLTSSPHSKKFFDSGDYAMYKAGIVTTPSGNIHPSPEILRCVASASAVFPSPGGKASPNGSHSRTHLLQRSPSSGRGRCANGLLPSSSSPCLLNPTKLAENSVSMEFLSRQLDEELGCGLSSSSED